MRMKAGGLQLVVAVLALATAMAVAYDPAILQDFCVAVNDQSSPDAVFVNGIACKNPSLATVDDFTHSGLNVPRDTSNKMGVNLTLINPTVIPGLNTLGINMVRIDLAANGGLNPPHEHPRASEILIVVEGTLYAGFVTTNPEHRLFAKVLGPGDVIVFPVGLIHFQYNIGKTPGLAFAALSSQNPGIMSIGNAMFGAEPPIMEEMLAKAFQLDEKVVRKLQRKTWINPEGDNLIEIPSKDEL